MVPVESNLKLRFAVKQIYSENMFSEKSREINTNLSVYFHCKIWLTSKRLWAFLFLLSIFNELRESKELKEKEKARKKTEKRLKKRLKCIEIIEPYLVLDTAGVSTVRLWFILLYRNLSLKGKTF